VGDNKRKDSESVLARIKKFVIENREKDLPYSILDFEQKASLNNELFPIKSEISIIQSLFN